MSRTCTPLHSKLEKSKQPHPRTLLLLFHLNNLLQPHQPPDHHLPPSNPVIHRCNHSPGVSTNCLINPKFSIPSGTICSLSEDIRGSNGALLLGRTQGIVIELGRIVSVGNCRWCSNSVRILRQATEHWFSDIVAVFFFFFRMHCVAPEYADVQGLVWEEWLTVGGDLCSGTKACFSVSRKELRLVGRL